MTQGSLFDGGAPAINMADPRVDPAERPRLSRQCVAILHRLIEGSASNHELSGIALKYTGRISDIRKSGISVVIESRDYETGAVVYKLGANGDVERAKLILEIK